MKYGDTRIRSGRGVASFTGGARPLLWQTPLGPGPSVFPLINVFTDADGVLVRAEVPGIKPDQVQVQVEPGRLTISGQRTPARTDASFHRRERRYGTFSRTVQLPRDLDPEQARAEFRNGLLTVWIPRHAAAKPRTIAVKAA